jgi:hypothetical protein
MKSSIVILAAAALLSACGGGSEPGTSSKSSAAEAELPLRRGDVWEVDPASAADAQALAYLYGLHAFVRQGDGLFTANTRLTNVKKEGDVLVASLGDGVEARLEERDGKSVLAFSTGPVATLREHQAPEGKQ